MQLLTLFISDESVKRPLDKWPLLLRSEKSKKEKKSSLFYFTEADVFS